MKKSTKIEKSNSFSRKIMESLPEELKKEIDEELAEIAKKRAIHKRAKMSNIPDFRNASLPKKIEIADYPIDIPEDEDIPGVEAVPFSNEVEFEDSEILDLDATGDEETSYEDIINKETNMTKNKIERFTGQHGDVISTSALELYLLNSFLFNCIDKPIKDIEITQFLRLGGAGYSHVCLGSFKDRTASNNTFIVKMSNFDRYKSVTFCISNTSRKNTSGYYEYETSITYSLEQIIPKNENDSTYIDVWHIYKHLLKLAFNKSKYTGKCIEINVRDGLFIGITVIDIENNKPLILSETQEKFMNHFISIVKSKKSCRYLLDGEPGSGKTELIRNIIQKIGKHATFVVPSFKTPDDLNSILTAVEIFEPVVIVMDDMDLLVGNREIGTATYNLSEFLSFFDGLKKRKISILASTNDKSLVDKAAERPGRFHFTLNFGFLTDEQIEQICHLYIDKKFEPDKIIDVIHKDCRHANELKITGAFIANFSENLKEFAKQNKNWDFSDTKTLLIESYRGFYNSQLAKDTKFVGFKKY